MPTSRWMTSIVLALMTRSAVAAVYGLPEPPTPAPTPQFWLNFSDDFLGMAVLNTDDHRTANLTMGGRYDAWRLGADYSMLTNRGDGGSRPSRSDEVTASLGYAIIDTERNETAVRSLLTIGAGARMYGNLGGETAQNEVHRSFGYPTLYLPYDPQSGIDGFAFYHGRLTLAPPWEYQLAGPFGHWELQFESGGLGSALGEVQVYGCANLVSYGHNSMAWLGARYQWNGETHPTETAALVAAGESGWWLVVGLARTPGIMITASINPAREVVAGTVGFSLDTAVPAKEGPGYHVEESLKFYPHGGNLGVDIRWQPQCLADHSCSQRDTLLIAYDFGVDANYAWRDNKITFDQLVIGWGPTWEIPTPLTQLVWTAGGSLAGGVRLERLRLDGSNPRFPQDNIKTAAVGLGELATRVGWRFTNQKDAWYNQFRAGIGVDGWVPFPSLVVTNGSDHDRYQIPGWSVHVSLGLIVNW